MDWTDRIGRRLHPRDLHLLLAVLEEGSMSKAAERLGVSRPVVSRGVQALETLLGVKLFDRTPAGVAPTEHGAALGRRGLAVFDELRLAVQELAALSDPNAGELRIGTSELTGPGIVASAVARLSLRYPGLRIHTHRADAMLRLTLLRERRVDLVVTRIGDGEDVSDIDQEVLAEDRPVVICGAGSRWARRRQLTLAALAEEHWILAPLELTPNGPAARAFAAAGLTLPSRLTVSDSLPLRYSLLATGRFVTVMPDTLLRLAPQPAWVKPLPLVLPPWPGPTMIATLRHRSLPPAARLFMAEARAVLQEISAEPPWAVGVSPSQGLLMQVGTR